MKEYTILYVDDEQANTNSFKSLFRRKFNILTANSGQKGLELLESQLIHLIITDQRMPIMTGVDFLKIAKKKWPNVKSILITGYQDNQVIQEAINDVGIFWYMNKPFENEKLELVIRKALEALNSEELLKESEQKYKGVFNSFIDVFIRRDLDHNGLLVSPSVLQVTGYTVDDIVGKDISQYFVDPEKPEWIKNYLVENSGVHTIEFDLYKKDGTIVSISSNAKAYYSQNGKPEGIESVFRDITNQKEAELKILEYQKLLKDLATDLTLSEENIRKKIAIDLHDDVGQLLSAARMQISVIDYELDISEIKTKINNVSQDLLQAIQSTRSVIFNLSPPQINEIGIYAAIYDWMKEQIEYKHNIKTNLTGKNERYPLEENARFLIFRNIRELMINVVKHAKAKHLNINIKRNSQIMEITVQDDGVGFDSKSGFVNLKRKSFGLFSIKERMGDLGGSMKIDSQLGVGTRVKLTIPIME